MPQVEGENKSPDLPLLHKRRAPEGTQFDNDLRMGLQLHDMSTAEKCVMWNKYQKALVRENTRAERKRPSGLPQDSRRL